ncbi:hypothetical protein ACFV4E_22655 [Streptomyces hygroscopicus]|uniref:hypothetical protein n=1 Tax=Streptomyces hygroscopicus TaxID=1912 RepID=UPI0036CEBFDD
MTATDETWICPANPFGHKWDDTGLHCSLCDAARTAAEAIASLVGSHRGWTVERAERLAATHHAEVLRDELQAVLIEWPCTHDASDDEHSPCPAIRVHRDDAERFAELRDESEKRRKRMAAAETDLRDIRETLAPNGYPRRAPMDLGDTIAPVIEWLLNERDELKEQLLTALGNVAREAARAEQAESRLETVRQSARREEMTRRKRDAQIIILGDQLKKRGVTNAEISEWIESVS